MSVELVHTSDADATRLAGMTAALARGSVLSAVHRDDGFVGVSLYVNGQMLASIVWSPDIRVPTEEWLAISAERLAAYVTPEGREPISQINYRAIVEERNGLREPPARRRPKESKVSRETNVRPRGGR